MANPGSVPVVIEARPGRRRAWRVSVRGLMVLVLVVGGPLGWQARRASIQRRAVAAIRAAGGEVRYEHQFSEDGRRRFLPSTQPPAPAWLRRAVGDEPFQDVAGVGFGDPFSPPPAITPPVDAVLELGRLQNLWGYQVDWTDADVARLAALRHLQSFSLSGPRFTAAALGSLRTLPDLTGISLWGDDGQLRASGLRHLAGMDRLEFLSLIGFHGLEPADLDALRILPRLRSLRLAASPADDRFVAGLQALDRLETLDLRQTRLTDGTLVKLANLPNLRILKFDGAALTDAGLATLGSMWWLRYLELDSEDQFGGYTDAGLLHLGRIKILSTLSLHVGKITAGGVARLYQAHPDFATLDLSGLQAEHQPIAQILANRPSANPLNMAGPGIADAWVPMLVAQPGRTALRLSGTAVTDAGAALLAAYPTLELLNLDGSELTDAGLLALARAPRLWTLSIRGAKVTEAGIAAFRAARPLVRLDAGPLLPPATRPALSGYR